MEVGDNLRLERKHLLRTILRNILVKGHELGQPFLIHIPDKDIPDTPIEEFERGIEEFFKEPRNNMD
jgi:hypothetical protein